MKAAPHGNPRHFPHRGMPNSPGYPAATGGMPPSASPPGSPRDLMSIPQLHGHPPTMPPGYGAIPQLPASYRDGHNIYEQPQASTSAIAPNPLSGSSTAIVPYIPPDSPAAAAPAAKSKFSLGDIKGAFDRLGGVDGIITHMGKFQKVMASVTEMMPMAKMLIGSFTSGKKKGDEDEELFYDPRPKKRRRKSTVTRPRRKRPSASKSRTKPRSQRPFQPRR